MTANKIDKLSFLLKHCNQMEIKIHKEIPCHCFLCSSIKKSQKKCFHHFEIPIPEIKQVLGKASRFVKIDKTK